MRFCFQPSLRTLFIIQACIQVFGIYIFLKGFLLTRQTFDIRGHSRTPWEQFPLSSPSSTSLLPIIQPGKPFDRAIFIVIDALRFDFVASSNITDRHYLNKIPIIQHLLNNHPQSSLLFQFRADPPTTTMQRVKGLMTGSLPTFIDAGSNFASSAVQEDHLLHHLKSRFNSIYFMGDDTWVHLYPDVFDHPQRTFDSDSFKMLDLDSVDNAILSHLWPLMEEADQGRHWDLAVAHFLGVDHCGHTHGPAHPNMARKLDQMNSVIERILHQVNDNTLLVLMGDHGMSPEGDHGGESLEELMSTLFVYSGRPLLHEDEYYHELYTRIHDARAKRLGYDIRSISERLEYDATRYPVIAQIHLVPTLAYLFQVPIPFGNLGAIVPNVLLPGGHLDNKMRNLLYMIGQFRMNALQVRDYLIHYSQHTQQADFSLILLEPILQHFHHADDILFELASQTSFIASLSNISALSADELYRFQEQLENALLEYDAFLTSTIKYCESIWAHFDAGSMLLGIILLVLGTCLSIWLMISKYQGRFYPLLAMSISLAVCVMVVLQGGSFEKMNMTDWIGVFLLSSTALLLLGAFDKESSLFSDRMVVLMISLIQSLTLGSNSYVVWEDYSTKHILSALTFIWLIKNCAIQQPTVKKLVRAAKAPLLFLVVIRLNSITGQCREEQFPYCRYIQHDSLPFDDRLQTFFLFCFLGLISVLMSHLSRVMKDKIGKEERMIRGIYGLCCVMVMIRIIQEVYQSTFETNRELPIVTRKILNVYLPRLVYGSSLFCMIHVFCTSRLKRSQKAWSILLLWSNVLGMIQRPLGAMIVFGSCWMMSLLNEGDGSSLLLRLMILQYYGHHLFFVTGHQATFTSLPWKAAFVGFDEMSYYGGMILVTLSTLTGYLISWIGWLILLPESDKENKKSLYLLVLMQSIPTCLCSIFVFILKRHLMTWKIFAPRFLFQTLLNIGAHLIAIFFEKNI